jgi:hypothetical protein
MSGNVEYFSADFLTNDSQKDCRVGQQVCPCAVASFGNQVTKLRASDGKVLRTFQIDAQDPLTALVST